MKRIIPSLLVTLLIVGLISLVGRGNAQGMATGQLGSVGEQAEITLIKKMEEDRVQAGVRKDVEAIAAATADEYLQIDFDGNVRDKAAAMQRIKSSAFQLQSNSLDDMVVRIFGNTAVVTARSTPKGTLNGKDFGQRLRYSRVYVKRDGRWRVVMFQMTHVAGDK
jgi:ketosteroid isomerase-like protein